MEYLADTVTIIRHFSKTGRIGRQARSILGVYPELGGSILKGI
jgi:hypothetical protein